MLPFLANNLAIISFGIYCSRPKQALNNPYYQKTIAPLYKTYEAKRRRTLIFAGIKFWGCIALLCLALVLINSSSIYDLTNLKLVLFVFCILLLITPVRKFRSQIANEILPKILKQNWQLDFAIKPNKSIISYQKFRIIPAFTSELSKDYISGNYKNLDFEMFSTRLIKIVDRNNVRQVFNGTVIRLSINKKFSGTTVIKRDYGLLNILNLEHGLSKVALEDPEFEDQFEVFASDQIEARYLLTTSLMARILDFKEAVGCKRLTACFHEQQLLIMLDGFKISLPNINLSEPADFCNYYHACLNSTESFFKHLDLLKLDDNLGI